MGAPANERTIAWYRSRLPSLKLVVLVKSPADRLMSNPNSAAKLQRFQASLRRGDTAMPAKLQELVKDNCYVDKLEPWLAFFPADRVLLIKSEDLRDEARRPLVLNEVTEFLGAGPHACTLGVRRLPRSSGRRVDGVGGVGAARRHLLQLSGRRGDGAGGDAALGRRERARLRV